MSAGRVSPEDDLSPRAIVRITCAKCDYVVLSSAADAAAVQHRHDGIDWRRFDHVTRVRRL